jgi:hypothetical protein
MAIILTIYSAILALSLWQENQNGQQRQQNEDKLSDCRGD